MAKSIYYTLYMIFITADVLNSAHFDSISLCEQFEINFWLVSSAWASSAHKFSLAKMASEAQKPLGNMEFLLVCG